MYVMYVFQSTSPLSTPVSPGAEQPPVPGSDLNILEEENKDLLNRIALIQQEKWNLEEKVKCLKK